MRDVGGRSKLMRDGRVTVICMIRVMIEFILF
jgi:hypothetical protein